MSLFYALGGLVIVYCGTKNMLKTSMECIVIPVNTVGIMGCGMALWAKNRFPALFVIYKKLCKDKALTVGKLYIHEVKSNKYVLLFPTKTTWSSKSRIEYIEAGLIELVNTYKDLNIVSVSLPALGCGYGGLNFEVDVKPLLYKYLDEIPIPVEICLLPQKNTA